MWFGFRVRCGIACLQKMCLHVCLFAGVFRVRAKCGIRFIYDLGLELDVCMVFDCTRACLQVPICLIYARCGLRVRDTGGHQIGRFRFRGSGSMRGCLFDGCFLPCT